MFDLPNAIGQTPRVRSMLCRIVYSVYRTGERKRNSVQNWPQSKLGRYVALEMREACEAVLWRVWIVDRSFAGRRNLHNEGFAVPRGIFASR